MEKINFYFAFFISLFVVFLVMIAEVYMELFSESDKLYGRTIFAGLFLAGSSAVARKILILSGRKPRWSILGVIAGISTAVIFTIVALLI